MPSGHRVPARITNESSGGAKLRVGWKEWLPEIFELQDVFSGVHRVVQTVWRRFSLMGVRFRGPKPDETQRPDFGRRHSE